MSGYWFAVPRYDLAPEVLFAEGVLGGRGGGRGALGRLRTLDLSHNFIMAMDGDSLAGRWRLTQIVRIIKEYCVFPIPTLIIDPYVYLIQNGLCTLDEKEPSNLLCYLPDSNSKAYIK